MNIQYTGHNVDINDHLKAQTQQKMEKLNTYHDHITSIHVTFSENNLEKIAEATIAVPGNVLHAKSEANDHQSAVDAMIDKLARQLKKHKEKQEDHR